eukprot:sb/3464577/
MFLLLLVLYTVQGGHVQGAASGPAPPAGSPPNIVIMLMDDMGWGDIGVHGRLPIRNGFYTTNRHGVNAYTPQQIVGGIDESEILLSELLKEVFRDDKMIGRYFTNFTIQNGVSNLTQLYIKEGLDFIDKNAHSETPFLLYWTPDANHQPQYSSEMFHKKSIRGTRYGDSVMEVDYGVGLILKRLKDLGIDKNTLVVFTSDNGAETLIKDRGIKSTYVLSGQCSDHSSRARSGSGQCSDSICETRYGRSTQSTQSIPFSITLIKDRGGSNGPLLCGKQTTFDGGMREPGIFWWPGVIAPGQVTHQLGTTMDIFVTAAQLAGLPLPSDRQYDGIDLWPVLSGEVKNIDRAVWFYRGNEMFAARVGRYKVHYWTWSHEHYEFCPGQRVSNLTTIHQVNRTVNPIVIDIENDPGEKYFLGGGARKAGLKLVQPWVDEHRATLVPGRLTSNNPLVIKV